MRRRSGRWRDRFELYVRSGSRKKFEQFLDHVENEGKQPSNVIMDLVEGYVAETKGEKQIKETETMEEETGTIERE